jgi:hypothetical protein
MRFPPLIYFNAFSVCDVRIAAAGQEAPGRNAANPVSFQPKQRRSAVTAVRLEPG